MIKNCSSHTAQSTGSPAATGVAAPRGRASWSGLLRLSLVAVPIKAYPAVSMSETIRFNQLHNACGQRVRYEKHCPLHGKVPTPSIVRGYEYAPDQYVIVEAAELERLRPAADKALQLEQFVDAHHIDPALFSGRSLYLFPDGPAAHRPFLVLAEAMQRSGRWAVGRVVLSAHRRLVVVRAVGRLLALHVLHDPRHVRAAGGWESQLRSGDTSPQERQLAATLIEAASRPTDWSNYHDDTADQIAALVEAKIAGRSISPAAEEPAQLLELLDALQQSVAAVEGPCPTQSAAGLCRQPKSNGRRSP